ncbi:hypothetical protein ATM97_27750 [Nocardia sp. MH4]|uniref:hypothetical protein n=1 Tax=Nocardia sp. MH4 TaxID=1768677 RepID=UPI001C4E9F06|nr:hypothetical protein [Nocardia sp. MH4]MBW0274999.1 hypothetical protein [Nocardia sp. MH4]
MNPIGIAFGQTVTVLRGSRDRTGDQALVEHHTIDAAVFWPESVSGTDDRRDTSTVHGQLAVPRSADLLATDHVRLADGSIWVAVGAPQWDHVHPMTGWNPGYKVARVKGVS